MEIKKPHILGIIFAVIILVVDIIIFRQEKIFYFITGISVAIGALPFVVSIILENQKEKENDRMFLEFSRNLVENVKAGTPISNSIINLRNKYYGSLTPAVKKLANQIAIGIPVKKAFEIFSKETNSKMISRAVNLISEAEKAGGNIADVLDSASKSLSEAEKIKKERRAAIYSLVVQGYIIFFVFIVIMLVMQFKILPMTSEISSFDDSSLGLGLTSANFTPEDLSRPLLYLIIIQGVFSGLIIGKLAEGEVKAGIKHSFILSIMSFLAYSGAGAFF